ncbi:MAG: hypothetical protein JXQ87_17915 [Bacteroidia bacterium]
MEIGVGVQKILFDRDSVKSFEYVYLCPGCKATTNYFNSIRVDIIATDKTMNDTLFLKTLYCTAKGNIELEIKKDVNEIDKALTIKPRLMLSDGFISYVYKIGDTIKLKLDDNIKIDGKIESYNDSCLVIQNDKNQLLKIQPEKIVGIKNCGHLFYYRGRHSRIKICRYEKTENLKIIQVIQFLNDDDYFEWKPIN